MQAEDFGVFLFHDSDEIVQKGDVPKREEWGGQHGSTMESQELSRRPWLNPNSGNELRFLQGCCLLPV